MNKILKHKRNMYRIIVDKDEALKSSLNELWNGIKLTPKL